MLKEAVLILTSVGVGEPGKIDGAIRPLTLIKKREDFFTYHQFLRDNGVECGDVGGFLQKGRVLFHFYDADGNRFNVSHC